MAPTGVVRTQHVDHINVRREPSALQATLFFIVKGFRELIITSLRNRFQERCKRGGAPFQTTHWTVVLQAGGAESDESRRKALASFSEGVLAAALHIRSPPRLFARGRTGHRPGFFVQLLEQNTLSRADRERGRLRTFC
mgnify:CR=1 FL=1